MKKQIFFLMAGAAAAVLFNFKTAFAAEDNRAPVQVVRATTELLNKAIADAKPGIQKELDGLQIRTGETYTFSISPGVRHKEDASFGTVTLLIYKNGTRIHDTLNIAIVEDANQAKSLVDEAVDNAKGFIERSFLEAEYKKLQEDINNVAKPLVASDKSAKLETDIHSQTAKARSFATRNIHNNWGKTRLTDR